MSCHAGRAGQTAQTTCCRRPSSTTTESYARALEITHAFRLRHKLAAASPGPKLVINVWGVGYRLCDSEVRQ
jgi:DNA-binding response OmpR family regulator